MVQFWCGFGARGFVGLKAGIGVGIEGEGLFLPFQGGGIFEDEVHKLCGGDGIEVSQGEFIEDVLEVPAEEFDSFFAEDVVFFLEGFDLECA